MDKIIGYKGTTQDRYTDWTLMLIYKRGYRILRKDPATKGIADKDLLRYKKILTDYIAA